MERGEIIADKYRLIEPLGSGGMAEVWAATNTFTEREVAIKLLHPHVARTPEAAARFLNEAKVSARVNHPNIVDVIDVGQTADSQLFLVMERLYGQSLETALNHQALSAHGLAKVMIAIASALAAAHRIGILHRDLKPTNIFLHKASPKLLDFGVSKFMSEDASHGLTMAGTVLGSPFYMSPEQARGELALDGRTDIFAFGAILFEALCGYRPYDGKTFNALIVKVATTRPKDIDACAPHAPASLRAIVRRCLEPNRDARFASFDEIIARLEAALPELETASVPLPLPLDAAAKAARSTVLESGTMPLPLARPNEAPSGNSWPSAAYALPTLPPPRQTSRAWIAASACALGLLAIVTAATVVFRSPHADLPRPAIVAAPPAGPGRLSIAASPHACAITIDGTDRGSTPLAELELAPGEHHVFCRPESGKTRTATVTVGESATTKYRFALDD